jgi:hypothetical protein
MNNKRLVTWLLVSILAGILWGIWQGGIVQGCIYGGMAFIILLVYERYKIVKK